MSEITLAIDSGVATITLDAPDRRNALTTTMADELVAACDAADDDPAVAVVVVTANGVSFCAGADRAVLATAFADPAGDEAFDAISRIYRAFMRVGELRVPTIAAVRGHAVGAGLNLVLATDLRIVADGATLSGGFVKLGIHPGGGHFALLARAAGAEAAAALGIFGEAIDGRRAAAIGLAWESLPADEVEGRAHELASHAAADRELARAAKASLRASVGPPGLPWPAALEMERGVQMRSMRKKGMA